MLYDCNQEIQLERRRHRAKKEHRKVNNYSYILFIARCIKNVIFVNYLEQFIKLKKKFCFFSWTDKKIGILINNSVALIEVKKSSNGENRNLYETLLIDTTRYIFRSFTRAEKQSGNYYSFFCLSSGCIVVVPRELEVAAKMKMDCAVFFWHGVSYSVDSKGRCSKWK